LYDRKDGLDAEWRGPIGPFRRQVGAQAAAIASRREDRTRE
jgi:hypothetical protein